jgi:signal transduction histidine kinase
MLREAAGSRQICLFARCDPAHNRNLGWAMTTNAKQQSRALLSLPMLAAAWLPACAITVLHYATGAEHHWFHDVLRRLYYLPIIIAAFSAGLRGGLSLAAIVALAYSPHAFTHVAHMDPAGTLEKVLELVIYLLVGGVSGLLVDRERARQSELEVTAAKLRDALDEQRRTADQLARAGRLAALGELVAGIAHEVKNPLHALRGTAEVVERAVPESAPERRMWELHKKELERLDAVAERFLSFARPAPLAPRSLDPRQVLERTAALIAAQASQQRVEVAVAGDERAATAQVLADEGQLTQVLLNISLNALQAIATRGGGGSIRLSLADEQRGDRRYLALRVVNDGPPIPEPDLERIFDPFVTTKSEGSGLGLSIASRIVEQHGGFIEARNLPAGVAFSVLLPI